MDDLTSAAYEVAFDALAGVYLEDSWVLEVTVQDEGCTFELDAVLTPEHPRYRDPRPGEQYCYERARLTLTSGSAVEFQPDPGPPATDATGEQDWGNIDTFVPVDWEGRAAWALGGGWGTLLLAEPSVTYTPATYLAYVPI